ncbi:heterokaryon incompatibility protein-domain-containing protein [Lasiosphaeris hirsuta]|uniref:Heterokaryon incompatibility protein-domain-containing protein n=1 Tax=Lasiosphaeris hirsuta TaxID=260670 RepID=A0AA40A3R4_9PEZI|nr:heterokaryon incompatibility protein-domain-containing protein [Lasiosphaeris hirsuta]
MNSKFNSFTRSGAKASLFSKTGHDDDRSREAPAGFLSNLTRPARQHGSSALSSDGVATHAPNQARQPPVASDGAAAPPAAGDLPTPPSASDNSPRSWHRPGLANNTQAAPAGYFSRKPASPAQHGLADTLPTPPQDLEPREPARQKLGDRLKPTMSWIPGQKPEQPTRSGAEPQGSGSRGTSTHGEEAESPSNKLRLPSSLRKVTNLSNLEIEGSISGGDLRISDSQKEEKKDGLCSVCSKINFETLSLQDRAAGWDGPRSVTTKLIFLDRIIKKKKRGTCKFCSLLFDAIAENDPLEHPAVKNHLDARLAGLTFRKWAEGLDFTQHIPLYESAYPFGRSRDRHSMKQTVDSHGAVKVEGATCEDDTTAGDVAGIIGIGATTGIGVGILTETDTQRMQIMATVGTVIPTITSLVASLNSKLPVAVSIIIHGGGGADTGLLNVDVWGYGNGHRAPLARISTFNLRVASGYERIGDELRYGNILGPRIDVEGGCKLWLDTCLGCHGARCDDPGWGGNLPFPSGPHFRLIDVNAMRVAQFDPAVLARGVRPQYAALSYVWGVTGALALNLHVRNMHHLATSLYGRDRRIAGTIRDAIDVTRRLGLQYLWVDSLCVIQKDAQGGADDAAARASQISQMDSIYGYAQVTLVAADGPDAEAGLLGVGAARDSVSAAQIAAQITPSVNVLLAAKYPSTYSKWDTRAWTLQEKLLSKRLLIFNGGRVSFHCRGGVLREDMPASHAGNGPPQISWLSLPGSGAAASTFGIQRQWDGTPAILRAASFAEYAALVGQYSGREMSDSRDALNAASGLLRVLDRMASNGLREGAAQLGHTLYGLPERFLDLALLWQPPATKGVYLTRKSQNHLPSWSWAGWEVGANDEFCSGAGAEPIVKPGVRFEQPFWVAANDDLSLRKVTGRENTVEGGGGTIGAIARAAGGLRIAGKVLERIAGTGVTGTNGQTVRGRARQESARPVEERYRPLVTWYKGVRPAHSYDLRVGGTAVSTSPTAYTTQDVLAPINGNGLGLTLDSASTDVLGIFRQDMARFRGRHGPPIIAPDVPLDDRHLVCETQVAKFRLRRATPRTEKLWKQTDGGLVVDQELVVAEAEVLNDAGEVVGKVVPTDARQALSSEPYHLVLLSESQYWGDEERVDVPGLPLYNVMVVEWDVRGEFASRLAVGKLQKAAWWQANPSQTVLILD